MSKWIDRAGLALLLIGLGLQWLVSGTDRFGRLGFPMDDPYIHFQFARNLASGAGFAFNPHEPVPGATSPLWVGLLAATRWLGLPTEAAAVVLGIASAALAALLTYEVGTACGLKRPWALLAATSVAAAGRFTWASLSGMEVCLAAALSLALVRVHASSLRGWRRGAALGLVAGLAANARPELALLGAGVWVLEAFGGGPAPAARTGADLAAIAPPRRAPVLVAYALTFAAAVAPYVVFCLATTGRPLPNTFYAKSLIPLSFGRALAGRRAAYLPEMLQWTLDDNLLVGVLLIPGLVLWWLRRAPRAARAVGLWPLLFWAYALALYPQHFSLSRYTIPLLPFLALLAMAPLEWLLPRLRLRARWALLVSLPWILCASGAARSQMELRPVYLAQAQNILAMQVAMGDWVATHLPPRARIATHDVGAITWYGGRYCIDTVGLVNSELIGLDLESRRRGGELNLEAVVSTYLAHDPPDFCIFFPSWYPNLVRAPWLRPIHVVRFPNVTGGGDELVVFEVVGRP
jgi:arabinofuranosyltransferase